MTVQELMEILQQMDPNTEVVVWDTEYGVVEPIDGVEVEDGQVVIY